MKCVLICIWNTNRCVISGLYILITGWLVTNSKDWGGGRPLSINDTSAKVCNFHLFLKKIATSQNTPHPEIVMSCFGAVQISYSCILIISLWRGYRPWQGGSDKDEEGRGSEYTSLSPILLTFFSILFYFGDSVTTRPNLGSNSVCNPPGTRNFPYHWNCNIVEVAMYCNAKYWPPFHPPPPWGNLHLSKIV